jgi:hypothetical protein
VGDCMNTESAPTPAELAAELVSLLRGGVTTSGLRDCRALLNLAITQASSASKEALDLAVAAEALIKQATRRVDDGAYGPAATLLAVAPGSRGTLLKERRKRAAEMLFVSQEHLRKEREVPLMQAVADELFAADSAYRLRHKHRLQAERSPEHSGLGIDWLEQHRSYRRIWTPVSGMKNDIAVLRSYLSAVEEDQPAIADRLTNITWHWARFSLALERFIREQGGLWLLADAESEIAAADAIYELGLRVPFGAADSSWLRTLLVKTQHEELDGFGDCLVEAGERRRELMGLWIDWASCPQGNDVDCDCDLHGWLRAANLFIRLIDDDWYRIADFYKTSDSPTGRALQNDERN